MGEEYPRGSGEESIKELNIFIGNKKFGCTKGEYVGRPSPLGNPFPLLSEEERDIVIEKYKSWIETKINQGDEKILRELLRLRDLALRPEGVILLCWCAPQRCHAEVIRDMILLVDQADRTNP